MGLGRWALELLPLPPPVSIPVPCHPETPEQLSFPELAGPASPETSHGKCKLMVILRLTNMLVSPKGGCRGRS